jgi:preprotein translocase subunit SecY
VANPGFGFTLMMILALTTGAVFVMWLGEQITDRGIGNGMSLLIFFSIIEAFPSALMQTVELVGRGGLAPFALVLLLAVMLAVIAATIAVTMAARKIPVQIPRKVMGRGRIREGQKSFVPLRVNSAGVMPIIFAQSIIIVPGTFATVLGRPGSQNFSPGSSTGPGRTTSRSPADRLLHLLLHAIIFNPVDLAENLKKQGAFVPGVKPGARTAEYIDRVLTPDLAAGLALPGGDRDLPLHAAGRGGRAVPGRGARRHRAADRGGRGLDTVQQMQQHLLLRHYDGFMKRGRVKFRGGSGTCRPVGADSDSGRIRIRHGSTWRDRPVPVRPLNLSTRAASATLIHASDSARRPGRR